MGRPRGRRHRRSGALVRFHDWTAGVDIPERARLARTVTQREDEILAYHQHRYSNRKTEAANLVMEKLRRDGHGFRNFRNYRLSLLLVHGAKRDTRPDTRIRGRKPPAAA